MSEFAPPQQPFRPTPTRACLLLINFSFRFPPPPAPSFLHYDSGSHTNASDFNSPLLSTTQRATPMILNIEYSRDPSSSSSSGQAVASLEHSSTVEDSSLATQCTRRKITNRQLHLTQEPQAMLPEAHCPFFLDFKGTWWNSQALFAADAGLQARNTASRGLCSTKWTLLVFQRLIARTEAFQLPAYHPPPLSFGHTAPRARKQESPWLSNILSCNTSTQSEIQIGRK